MSIETLLEAAKFLELQAQQQQKAREDELKEKQRLEHLAERRLCDVNRDAASIRLNNVSRAEECHPPPVPPSLPPPSITVVTVVAPGDTLSPPAAAILPRPPQPKPDHSPTSVPTANHKQLMQNQNQHHQNQHQQRLIVQTNNTKLQTQLLHRYPGAIVSPPQQLALLPQPGPVVQQAPPPPPLQNGPISRGSPPDDGRQLDRKRPGGRAHLKECFDALKKNIPNIDEKKTSNLSVLRSALRYIQTLKRKEKEYEHDMERLAREKIATQQRLAELKSELSQWMDVMEVDRVLRQTVQPEEDQASTSTASEGEDVLDDDLEDEIAPRAPPALPAAAAPQPMKPEPHKPATPTQTPAAPSSITQHISIQHDVHPPPQLHPPPLAPAPAQMVAASGPHPTVIAHASVSHPSVIQAVNHVIQQGGGAKHIAHLAPPGAAHQPVGRVAVHPAARPAQRLPALYPPPTAVAQSAAVGHIAHTLSHAHPRMNGAATGQPAAAAAKQRAGSAQMVTHHPVTHHPVTHHPQLVGQTVLNPVTMVTVPSFPIGTLKLA
ncbi:max-binding protein MNT isoform X2 [Pseudoliparis swirei]|uniref:max-binding protein MNT isoform X2 n=1 Tax=Pseudoliparis swirei TaxID=2059687 RepID=UPI0024BDAD17|nr:max-binding protein MNT isoform X2 [Pseudoliparis swirei]